MTEALVVLSPTDPSAAQAARHRASFGGVRVRQSYGPGVLIVEGSPDVTKDLEDSPGVTGVYTGRVPAESTQDLDEMGRLGVAAWNERHKESYRAAKRRRKGEGLSWDHPDYEPEG